MGKVVSLLVSLFVVYFGIQIAFSFFGSGHIMEYKINDFQIKEVYTQNEKNERNNYYFEIDNGTVFAFQVFNTMNRGTNVITDVKYVKSPNYECVQPIFKTGVIYTDALCLRDGVYHNYNEIKGKDPEIDNALKPFVSEPIEFNSQTRQNGNLYVYEHQVPGHFIGLEYYKGLFDIYADVGYKKISLFKNDVYTKDISTLVGKYYLVADYTKDYDFNTFELVDLETRKTIRIHSEHNISLNSYVQGSVDNNVYIFDLSNKVQYRVDIANKTVVRTGDESKGVKMYKNGGFVEANAYEVAENKPVFDTYEITNSLNGQTFTRVEKVGNDLSGYYYVYQSVEGGYNVYRAPVQNSKILTYLFKTTNMNSVQYIDDYVYFIDGENINYCSDLTGIRTVIKYNELSFNQTLKYFVYKK